MGVKLETARFTIGYIGRYTKRPVIAISRIKHYNPQALTVTFEYQDKAEAVHKLTTLPVADFISLLIRHIPQPHFKQIRYSGLYAHRTRSSLVPLCRSLLHQTTLPLPLPTLWRQRTHLRTQTDPLICPRCHRELVLTQIVYRSRDGPPKVINFFRRPLPITTILVT